MYKTAGKYFKVNGHSRSLLRVPGAMCGSQNVSLIDEGAAAPELAPLASVQINCGHPRPCTGLRLRSTNYTATFVFTLAAVCPNNHKVLGHLLIRRL